MWGEPVGPRAGVQASATRRIYRQWEDRGTRSDKPESLSHGRQGSELFFSFSFLPSSFPPPSRFLSFLLLPHSFLLFLYFLQFPPHPCLSLPVSLSLSIMFLKKNNRFLLVKSIFTPQVASSLDGQTFVSGIRELANLKVVKLHVCLSQFSYSKYFCNNFHSISTSL